MTPAGGRLDGRCALVWFEACPRARADRPGFHRGPAAAILQACGYHSRVSRHAGGHALHVNSNAATGARLPARPSRHPPRGAGSVPAFARGVAGHCVASVPVPWSAVRRRRRSGWKTLNRPIARPSLQRCHRRYHLELSARRQSTAWAGHGPPDNTGVVLPPFERPAAAHRHHCGLDCG